MLTFVFKYFHIYRRYESDELETEKVHSPCSPRTNERRNGSRMLCRRTHGTVHLCHRILELNEWEKNFRIVAGFEVKLTGGERNQNDEKIFDKFYDIICNEYGHKLKLLELTQICSFYSEY